jgi:hypothetical protein
MLNGSELVGSFCAPAFEVVRIWRAQALEFNFVRTIIRGSQNQEDQDAAMANQGG